MKENCMETMTSPPRVQKIERLQTIEKEHKDALERAVTLKVPHAVSFEKEQSEHELPGSHEEEDVHSPEDEPTEETSKSEPKSSRGRANWDELVEKLFKKPESGELHLQRIEGASGSQNS